MNYRDEFEKIIEGINISPNVPKEEVDRQFLPLIQFIGKNVPEQLYKFRGCAEYSIDAFCPIPLLPDRKISDKMERKRN